MLLALAALWGASFMFIKVGVRELEPGTLICFRLALGTLTLLPVALVTVGRRELWRSLRANAGPQALRTTWANFLDRRCQPFAVSGCVVGVDQHLLQPMLVTNI